MRDLASVWSRRTFTYNDLTHVYMADSQRCRSITNVAKIPTDDFTLNQFRLRTAGIGLMMRPDLIEDIAAHVDDNRYVENVMQLAIDHAGANKASMRGTQYHAAAERGDLDQPLYTAQQEVDHALLLRTYDAYRITPHPRYVEQIVFYPDDLIAGRMDRYATIDGTEWLWDIDLKTGTSCVRYPHGTAVQLALHVNAPLIMSETRALDGLLNVTGWEPQPDNLRSDKAYILLMPTRDDADLGTLYEFTLAGRYQGEVAARAAVFCRHFQLNPNHCQRVEPPMPLPATERFDPVAQGDLRGAIAMLGEAPKQLLRMAWDVSVLGSLTAPMNVEQIAKARALVDSFDGFAHVSELPVAPVAEVVTMAAPRWRPDEGDAMPESAVASLRTAYESLPESQRLEVEACAAQATQYTVTYHGLANPGEFPERRYWLLLATMQLAANDSLDIDAVRFLAATVVDDDWPLDKRLTMGAVVGLLGAEHGEAFCDLTLQLIAGELIVSGNRLIPSTQ